MNRLTFILLIITYPTISTAKVADSVIFKIHYLFKHKEHLNKPQVKEEEMILYVGRVTSKYESYDRKKFLTSVKAMPLTYKSDSPSFLPIAGSRSKILSNHAESIIFIQDYIFNTSYLIADTIEVTKWKILDKEKIIGQFRCKSAQGEFRGRIYNIWFTDELPYSVGPWKFKNNPGTILEASDSSGEVSFTFKKIDFENNHEANNLNNRNLAISLKEFSTELKKEMQKPDSSKTAIRVNGELIGPRKAWQMTAPTNNIELVYH